MKKTTLVEDAYNDFQTFFETDDFTSNQIAINNNTAIAGNEKITNDSFPDWFLTAVKMIFIYFPGVVTIHFTVMATAFISTAGLYGEPIAGIALVILGLLAAGMFMVMFGIGKLKDLRYLRVVMGIFLTSLLCAIVYSAVLIFSPGDPIALFLKITLILPSLIGYFVKRNIDKELEESK